MEKREQNSEPDLVLQEALVLYDMKKGFTLIELLVVISIIGILIALSIFGLQGARESARDTKRKSDLEQMRAALELYKADCNSYPASPPAVGAPLVGVALDCGGTETYLESWPADPMPTTRNYSYTRTALTTYTLCAALENVTIEETGCGSCGDDADCSYKVTNP